MFCEVRVPKPAHAKKNTRCTKPAQAPQKKQDIWAHFWVVVENLFFFSVIHSFEHLCTIESLSFKCSNLLDGTCFLSNCLPVADDAASKDDAAEGTRFCSQSFSRNPVFCINLPPIPFRRPIKHTCMHGSRGAILFHDEPFIGNAVHEQHRSKRRRCTRKQQAQPPPWPLLIPRVCREKWKPRSTQWIGECEDWHHKV